MQSVATEGRTLVLHVREMPLNFRRCRPPVLITFVACRGFDVDVKLGHMDQAECGRRWRQREWKCQVGRM